MHTFLKLVQGAAVRQTEYLIAPLVRGITSLLSFAEAHISVTTEERSASGHMRCGICLVTEGKALLGLI